MGCQNHTRIRERRLTYITAATWICVRKPSTTNILTLLDELKVTDAVLPDELDGKTETGHASPYDQNLSIERHCE